MIVCVLLTVSWQAVAEEAEEVGKQQEDKAQQHEDDDLKKQTDESQKTAVKNDGPGLFLKNRAFDHRRFRRIGALVAFGVGGAAAIGAVITGAITINKYKTIAEDCAHNQCPETRWGTLDSTRNLATATDILIGVAAAGVTAGLVFVFIRPENKTGNKKVKVSPVAGLSFTGAVITGEF